MHSFPDRQTAGRVLAGHLGEFARRTDVTVLALPRGGVPVACEVAGILEAPVDVLLVEKVYAPGCDVVQIGTVASGGFELRDHVAALNQVVADREMAHAHEALEYRERLYAGVRPAPRLDGRTVILVYDGIATGALMVAAVVAARARGAARVIVAAPVAAPNACDAIRRVADACVAVLTPEPFYRIAIWYDDYAPVTDAGVRSLLERAGSVAAAAAA